MTSRYEIFKYSAMMNAAAPSTGGERIAPRPPAASSPPAASFWYPDFASIGHATEPIVTVVATPDPDGPPSRNDDSTTVRPAPACLPPIAAKLKSRKNLPAPDCCRNAPYIVNRMISDDETSTAVPKIPS